MQMLRDQGFSLAMAALVSLLSCPNDDGDNKKGGQASDGAKGVAVCVLACARVCVCVGGAQHR